MPDLSPQKHAARDESDEQAGGGPQSDEQVSRIGMSRPHPSLSRREMDLLGSLRPLEWTTLSFLEWQ